MKPIILSAVLAASPAIASTTLTITPDNNPITSARWQESTSPDWHNLDLTGPGTWTGPDHPLTGTDSVYLELDGLTFDLPNRPLIGQWQVQIDASAWPQAVWFATETDAGWATPSAPEPSTAVLLAMGMIGVCRRG